MCTCLLVYLWFFQQPSPRKKPRKQTLSSNSVRPGSEQQWGSSENDSTEIVKRKLAKNLSRENLGNQSGMRTVSPPRKPSANYIRDKPHMSLLNSYRSLFLKKHSFFKNCRVKKCTLKIAFFGLTKAGFGGFYAWKLLLDG